MVLVNIIEQVVQLDHLCLHGTGRERTCFQFVCEEFIDVLRRQVSA